MSAIAWGLVAALLVIGGQWVVIAWLLDRVESERRRFVLAHIARGHASAQCDELRQDYAAQIQQAGRLARLVVDR